MVTH